jgi:hypothetical protein
MRISYGTPATHPSERPRNAGAPPPADGLISTGACEPERRRDWGYSSGHIRQDLHIPIRSTFCSTSAGRAQPQETPRSNFDIVSWAGGTDGVIDHATRTSRSAIIKTSFSALPWAAEAFPELVPCVSFWSLAVCHPEFVIGSRYAFAIRQS